MSETEQLTQEIRQAVFTIDMDGVHYIDGSAPETAWPKVRSELLRLASDNDALRAEVERLKASQQWQPIETCPKDGSLFLIWVHAETHDENDDGLPTVTDNSCADIGWWRTGTDPMPYGYVDFGMQNTHDVDEPEYWMPLPEPPAERGEG